MGHPIVPACQTNACHVGLDAKTADHPRAASGGEQGTAASARGCQEEAASETDVGGLAIVPAAPRNTNEWAERRGAAMPPSLQLKKLEPRCSFSPGLPRPDEAPPGLSAPNRPRLGGFAAARCVCVWGGTLCREAPKPPTYNSCPAASRWHRGCSSGSALTAVPGSGPPWPRRGSGRGCPGWGCWLPAGPAARRGPGP